MATPRATFDKIYQENRWGGTTTRSNGPGGGDYAKEMVAPALEALVLELGVTSVLDVGCGETYWQPELPGYIGIDVSGEAIMTAKETNPDWDLRIWKSSEPLPEAELVIARHLFQHMTPGAGVHLIERIRNEAGALYLVATTYENGDNGTGFERPIIEGGGYWPNLTKPPFDLGEYSGYIEDTPNPRPLQMGARLAIWTLA